VKKAIKSKIRSVVQRFGIDIVRHRKRTYPPDFSATNIAIYEAVRPYTMTSSERVNSLVEAVRYIVATGIPGAIVECGVWKGGSTMAALLALKEFRDENRDVYLYDTFMGMSAPTDADISFQGNKASVKFSKTKNSEEGSAWCLSTLDEVRRNVLGTGYPESRIHFVRGKVEDTIPAECPGKIALLRLDTDWYESTKHELTHLFPLLQQNGVLIIDDYGHWEGARKAVDEYFAEKNTRIFLSRIDYTGRLAIKT
jgi:O-methyltransferase